jgi:2-polyprenyl-3-methyl-5-hydroxy-6-metoxy-1,4-benzoquinol methylase
MTISNLITVNCPICNSNLYQEKYNIHTWHIVACTNCAFVYTNPRLTNEAVIELYKQDYFHNQQFGYTDYNDNPHLKKMNFKKWIKDASPFFSEKENLKALDIGCAAGFGISAYENLNIKADGLEIDPNYVKELVAKGYNIYDKPLLENNFTNKYDIVSLFDVVEHLTDLHANFETLKNLLNDNGILIIVTPDFDSKQRKIFGAKWFQFKPIEHINYFTTGSLKKLAQQHNLELVISKKSGQFADANFIVNRLSKYNFKFANLLLKPFTYLAKSFNKSFYLDAASIYCVFRKK